MLPIKTKQFSILFLFLISISCTTKKTEVSTNTDLKSIAREIIASSKNCALITIDSLGIAHARTMDPFYPDENFNIWMATNPKSSKVNQIKNNSNVTLYYSDKENPSYVTLQGQAKLVNLEELKKKFWKDEWKNFYKNRTTDYLLIQFSPTKLNVISEKHKILGDSITWITPEILFEK
jgi:general stress protein 26